MKKIILINLIGVICVFFSSLSYTNEKNILTLDSNSYLKVKFKIVEDETGNPLRNRKIYICHFVFDIHYDPPPEQFIITSVYTDSNGVFSLDLSKIEKYVEIKETTHTTKIANDIVVCAGKPYNIERFGMSSDLTHRYSEDHIRIFYDSSGKVSFHGNRIYNLKNKTVKIMPAYSEPTEEQYEEILLVVKHINGKNVY